MSPVGKGGVYYDQPERAAWADLPTSVIAATTTFPEFNVQDADEILGKLIVTSLGDKEVQKIKIKATGGTWKITYATKQTAAIKWNASAAEVQAALVALSNLDTGDVVVTGGPGDEGGTNAYVLTFNLGADVAQVTVDATALTGGEHKAEIETSTAGSASGSVKVALETQVSGDWSVVAEFPEVTSADPSVGKAFTGLGTKCRWKATLGAGDGAKIAVQVSARD